MSSLEVQNQESSRKITRAAVLVQLRKKPHWRVTGNDQPLSRPPRQTRLCSALMSDRIFSKLRLESSIAPSIFVLETRRGSREASAGPRIRVAASLGPRERRHLCPRSRWELMGFGRRDATALAIFGKSGRANVAQRLVCVPEAKSREEPLRQASPSFVGGRQGRSLGPTASWPPFASSGARSPPLRRLVALPRLRSAKPLRPLQANLAPVFLLRPLFA